MGRIDDFVEAVTHRLRPDPELYMDIAQEVRAHLEDAIAEANAGGLSEEEATEAALKAFGDEQEVADGIWQANRRRMRLRAVVKWVARLSLVPAALLFTLYITVAEPLRLIGRFQEASIPGSGPTLESRSGLDEDQKFIWQHLSGDPSDAQALVKRFPDNPVFYAHYTRIYLAQHSVESTEAFEEALSLLDRGEEIEPDNAFYDYMKAALIMEHCSETVKDEGLGYEYVNRHGEAIKACGARVVITDRALFEEGVREFFEGARKPYSETYAVAMMELELELGRRPRSFLEQVVLVSREAAVLFPHLHIRTLATRLPGYAMVLASEGEREKAAEVAELMHRPGIQTGSRARTIIDLLVGRGMIVITRGQAPAIYAALGMPERETEALKEFEAENENWNRVWNEDSRPAFHVEEIEKRHGLLAGVLAPAAPNLDYHVVVPALRNVEHLLLQRAAFTYLVVLMMILTLLFGVFNCRNLWRYRKRADGPKLFFVGWRRVGWIILLALVLPVGLYWVYTRLTPLSSMEYGINYLPGRVAVELTIVLSLVVGGLLCLGYRAIRERCRDAGMDVPARHLFDPFRSPVSIAVLGLLAVGLVAYFAYWQAEFWRFIGGYCAAGALVFTCFVYLVWQSWRMRARSGAGAHFRRTLVRSMIPVLASALLVVGIASHAYLRWSEASHIGKLQQPGHRLLLDEVEMTSLKHYRDHLRELNRKWNEEHGLHPVPPSTRSG